ncbi:MAG: 4-hydroxybutyrate CoA-transferase [Clostridiales Family XIII bacterium]|nr:4-hydroxybutyrate CoA-transferase [Clostridiales Family XIII bacterium]
MVATAEEAVSHIKSGDRVVVGYAAGEPTELLNVLCEQSLKRDLKDVFVYQGMCLGDGRYSHPEYEGHIRAQVLFAAEGNRKAVWERRADFVGQHFSDINGAYDTGVLTCDVFMTTMTPPDERGYCSLGLEVDFAPYALRAAKYVIAAINPNMPLVYGENRFHVSEIDCFVESDAPICEMKPFTDTDPVSRKIGGHIADLIEDGATLQMGTGKISNAVLKYLEDRRDLGVHTEVFSDNLRPLIEKGVVNGAKKNIDKGKIVATMIQGSRQFYDYVDRNEMILMMPSGYTNNPFNIAKNDKVVALNASIEVDLLGQVNSEAIGSKQFSGVGGQVDFLRGAAASKGGKPVNLLPSTAKGGSVSRIRCCLEPGTPITVSRLDTHWVVTEYGAVNLLYKSLDERAKLLIGIAAPQFREQLEREWFEYRKRMSL